MSELHHWASTWYQANGYKADPRKHVLIAHTLFNGMAFVFILGKVLAL